MSLASRRSGARSLIVALLVAGCEHGRSAPPAPDGAGGVVISAPGAAPSPPSAREHPTTDGAIAVGNLSSQIAGYEAALSRQPKAAETMRRLASLLAQRAEFLGQLEDWDRAVALVEASLALEPQGVDAWLARAELRASLHRFSDALADLGEAARRGAKPDRTDGLRASILLATGHLDAALALRQAAVKAWPNVRSLGAQAVVLGALGRTDEAEAAFGAALDKFHDTSPFPLAWLWFQQGLLWERAGRLGRARELYEAAHARLPQHAAAAGHLAGILAAQGERDQAIALLRPLLDGSTDPEYVGQLAALLREAGQPDEAERLRARATKRFDDLLARHPEAFADHAARFFLGAGADGKRALALALRNLALRPTVEAHQLALEAALAGGTPAEACDLAARALTVCGAVAGDGGAPSSRCGAHLHVLASRAFSACGHADRAAAELRAAAGE